MRLTHGLVETRGGAGSRGCVNLGSTTRVFLKLPAEMGAGYVCMYMLNHSALYMHVHVHVHVEACHIEARVDVR